MIFRFLSLHFYTYCRITKIVYLKLCMKFDIFIVSFAKDKNYCISSADVVYHIGLQVFIYISVDKNKKSYC